MFVVAHPLLDRRPHAIISPSLVFLTAIFIFGEPMDFWRWLSFALLRGALAIYSYAAIKGARRLEVVQEPAQA